MAARSENLLRWRLWLLLSATFLALGAVAVLSVSRLALQRYRSDFSANLLTSAQLLANAVASGSETELGDLRRSIPNLEGVYVIHIMPDRVTSGVYSARTKNLTPNPLELATARSSLLSESPSVEGDSHTRFYRAYVPIPSQQKVLVLVEAPNEISAREAAVSTGILWALLVTGLLSLLFAQILASYLSPLIQKDVGWAAAALGRMVKGTVVELMLAVLSAVVIATAAFGFLVGRDLDENASRSLRAIGAISDFRTGLIAAMPRGVTNETQTTELHRLAIQADLPWPYEGKTLDMRKLIDLSQESSENLRRQSLNYSAIEDSANLRSQSLLIVFGVASFLSLGAIVLLRTARRQERELAEAKEDIARQEAASQHIEDNLPIGFFTYTPGLIETSNPAWDRLVDRQAESDRWATFVDRLHPEDRERVVRTFELCAQDLNPFGIAYRLVMISGTVRHVETRAVAIRSDLGGLEHIVGFLMDVSARVRAQRQLEEKNQEVQDSNDMLRRAVSDVEDNFEAMVSSLVKAVEAKDPYTAGHSERVMAYSLKIGAKLGLSADDMRRLRMGALVHDIGKIGIPDAILTKPTRLSPSEYEMIKEHPTLGYNMIESIPAFADCLPIVLHHHERLDGSGYPLGLSGLEIPLLVRICTVSDCFDAMTSDRAYRKGLDPAVAIRELLLASDDKIVDRHLVEVLASVIELEGLHAIAKVV